MQLTEMANNWLGVTGGVGGSRETVGERERERERKERTKEGKGRRI